jgi:diguanylate cyclase (GGDEF)-like protein/PAS domain S-box-containing protein
MPVSTRFKRWLIACALALNGLVIAAMVLSLQRSHREYEGHAEIAAQNLLLVLREQLASTFENVDAALQSLAEEAQRDMVRGTFKFAQFEASLVAKERQIDVIGAIGVADASGQVWSRTGVAPDQLQLNIAQREHFSQLRAHPRSGLVITSPVLSRTSREWVIPLARPILRADGGFAGVVYAHVTLKNLQQLFASLDVGPNGSIVLRDNALRLVLRHPVSESFEPGHREVSSELQRRILEGELSGRYRGTQPVDGIERLAFFSRVKNSPYYLIVGFAPQDYLAPWRTDAARMAVLAALFMAVSLASVWLILRHRARQQTLFDALQASEAKLAAILENTGAAVFVKDRDYRYVFANRTVLDFAGAASLDDMTGRSDAQLRPADTAARLRAHDRRVIEHGETVQAIERLVSPRGRSKYTMALKMPMRHPDGRIYGLCGISTDVTELVRTQRREQVRGQVLEMLARHQPLQATLETLARGIEADDEDGDLRCAIVLIEGTPPRLRTAAAPSLPDFFNRVIDGLEIGHGARSCGHAATTGERLVVEDIQSHPFWVDARAAAAQAGVRSCWAEPIRLPGGEVVGTFALYHSAPKSPQSHELDFIASAAHLAGIAIESHRQESELKIAAQVFEGSQEAMMVTDANDRIIAINQAFTQITGYARAEALNQRPNLLSSGRHEAAFFQAMRETFERTGHWQGELWNRRKNGDLYATWMSIHTVRNPQDNSLQRISLFTDITERKQADELAWRHANFDLLTQLPNRRLFFDRLDRHLLRSRRDGSPLVLMFLDLDQFKQVNDQLGPDQGDDLLLETAQRLHNSVRETDTVARLGGDEFAIILGEIDQPQDIDHFAQRLLDAVRQPFHPDKPNMHITASIGIAVYPEDGADPHSLLRNADQAMHAAKGQGRNRFSYFTAAMQQEAEQRLQLLADLRGALEKNQFELAFQPIVSLHDGRICKTEALLRWQHPQLGRISPADFIPLAEESGLINSIGDWVFLEALRQTRDWTARTGVPLQTSINVSPVQFGCDTFPAQWLQHLQDNGIAGHELVLEITEGILIHHRPDVARKLASLRQAGITVAIDDFGTGYSSLSYIKRFDIDVLKIDQSFVRDMATDFSSQALVEAMIVMAHKLDLTVVAEGIETAAQRDLLLALGCDYGQGYLFSRPLAATDFAQLLLAQAATLHPTP